MSLWVRFYFVFWLRPFHSWNFSLKKGMHGIKYQKKEKNVTILGQANSFWTHCFGGFVEFPWEWPFPLLEYEWSQRENPNPYPCLWKPFLSESWSDRASQKHFPAVQLEIYIAHRHKETLCNISCGAGERTLVLEPEDEFKTCFTHQLPALDQLKSPQAPAAFRMPEGTPAS